MTPAEETADLEACEAMLRAGSKSFHAASRLLPRRVRQPTLALYAFCRMADDHVDDLPRDATASKLDAVRRLEQRLHAVYGGAPFDSPVDRAFARTVERFAIPRHLPEALLDGMRWDAEGRDIPDESALLAYSARVAGVVGVMMTLIMGDRRPHVLARACDLGIAMQLTNIARDVGEDARNGRVYLPSTWLEEAGIDRQQWLEAPTFQPEVARVVARTLERAETLYRRGEAGIAALPQDCRAAISAASRIYASIGSVVASRSFDSVSSRAFVPGWRKAWLVLASLAGGLPPHDDELTTLPALAEAQFLVDVGVAA